MVSRQLNHSFISRHDGSRIADIDTNKPVADNQDHYACAALVASQRPEVLKVVLICYPAAILKNCLEVGHNMFLLLDVYELVLIIQHDHALYY